MNLRKINYKLNNNSNEPTISRPDKWHFTVPGFNSLDTRCTTIDQLTFALEYFKKALDNDNLEEKYKLPYERNILYIEQELKWRLYESQKNKL